MTWPQAFHDVGIALATAVAFLGVVFAMAWTMKE